MAGKARVSALAKELGVTSKDVLAKLGEFGEYVKSPSSTVEAPVARRLREAFPPATAQVGAKKVAAKKLAAQPAPVEVTVPAELRTPARPQPVPAPVAPACRPDRPVCQRRPCGSLRPRTSGRSPRSPRLGVPCRSPRLRRLPRLLRSRRPPPTLLRSRPTVRPPVRVPALVSATIPSGSVAVHRAPVRPQCVPRSRVAHPLRAFRAPACRVLLVPQDLVALVRTRA